MAPQAQQTFVGYSVPGSRHGVRYTILRDLNVAGAFGSGFLASEEVEGAGAGATREVFFKLMRVEPSAPGLVARELELARRHMELQTHVHVAQVLDVLPSGARATKAGAADWPLCGAVVMEMHRGGDLFTRLANAAALPGSVGSLARRALPEPHACYFFRQLVAGVNHLHTNKLYHRDIKPENVLLTDCLSGVKLTDFGTNKRVVADFSADMPLSTRTFGASPGQSMGTPGYQPPEALHLYENSLTMRYNPAAWDVWSLGQTLVIMLGVDCCDIVTVQKWTARGWCKKPRLRMPLETYTDTQLLQRDAPAGEAPTHPRLWAEHPAFVKLGARISPEARELLNLMMEPDPLRRITLGQLPEHPWLRAHVAGAKRRRAEAGEDDALAAARAEAEAAQAEMRSRRRSVAGAGGADDVPPVSDELAAAHSQQGGSGFLDVGYLVAAVSGGAPGDGAAPPAPLADDAALAAQSALVDCRASAAASPAEFHAAAAFAAVSQRLAALGLTQPAHARDHAALRLRCEGLVDGGCFTAQVIVMPSAGTTGAGRLFVHLQRLAPPLGSAASLPRTSSAPAPAPEPAASRTQAVAAVAAAAAAAAPAEDAYTPVGRADWPDVPSFNKWAPKRAFMMFMAGCDSMSLEGGVTDAAPPLHGTATERAPPQAPGAPPPPFSFGLAGAGGGASRSTPMAFGFAQRPVAAPAPPDSSLVAAAAAAAPPPPPAALATTLTLADVAEQLRLHFELEAQHRDAPAEADDAAGDGDHDAGAGGVALMPN